MSAAAAVSRDHGVGFLLLVDQGYHPEELLQRLGAAELPAGFSVLVRRAFPGRAGSRIWYDWLIPRLAKKHRVDAIFLTGGIAAASAPIPQCIWMPEKANPKEGKDYPPLYVRRLKESLSRAALVFCFSDSDKEWLSGLGADAAVVEPWSQRESPPLPSEQRDEIKDQYANGREYFLADVTNAGEEKITRLLKSFSLFKKRQLSNLQLILAGSTPAAGTGLQQRLETYKYREDVNWEPGGGGDRLKSAAYAFLFPFAARTLGVPVLDAWQSEVPVIIGKDTGLQQWAGDAVLVADMEDPASLAAHMMTIYKDERLRRELIEKGRRRVAAYSPQQPIDAIWAGLVRVIRQPAAGSM